MEVRVYQGIKNEEYVIASAAKQSQSERLVFPFIPQKIATAYGLAMTDYEP